MRIVWLLLLPILVELCGYTNIVANGHNISLNATINKQKYRLKRRRSGVTSFTWVPLKIYTSYTSKLTNLDPIDNRDLSNCVTRAIKRLGEMIKVRQLSELSVKDAFNNGKINLKDYNYVLFVNGNDDCARDAGKEDTLAKAGSIEFDEMRLDPGSSRLYFNGEPEFERLQDKWRGRPTTGNMTICLNQFIKRNKQVDDAKWTSTIMHEIAHALVFSPNLFANFMKCDASGKGCELYNARQKGFRPPPSATSYTIPGVVKKVELSWSTSSGMQKHQIFVAHTPAIKEQTSEYFQCSSMEGAELENQGGPGTQFSHLEKRVYMHETMGGTRTEVNAFSNITLAFFEDSGWYSVDYTKSENMNFGKGLGCDFVTKSCKDFIENGAGYPFCDSDESRCSSDHKFIEKCAAFMYGRPQNGIESQYRYFQFHRTYSFTPNGAPLGYADFCPSYTIMADAKGESLSSCAIKPKPDNGKDAKALAEAKALDEAKLQIFSKSARCVQLKQDGKDAQGNPINIRTKKQEGDITYEKMFSHSHGCYETKCENKKLWLKTAKSKFYPCYKHGQAIHVQRRLLDIDEDVSFTLICPACEDICGAANCEPHTGEEPGRVGDPARKESSMLDKLLGNGVSFIQIMPLLLFTVWQ